MTIFLGVRRAALALVLLGTLTAAAACGNAQAGQAASASPEHLSARDLGWLNEAHQANLAEMVRASWRSQTRPLRAYVRPGQRLSATILLLTPS